MEEETARGDSYSDHETRLSRLESRLGAVERTATGTETPVADLSDAAELDVRLTAVEESVSDLDDRLSELDAAVQALRGYVGGVRAVNRDVKRRADAALAAVESLERRRAETDVIDELAANVESTTAMRESPPDDDTGEETSAESNEGLAARLRETW
ncbi:DUF7310 family coiled-coil domain-containing protein [Haloprofundus halobius]|uniref:DUF7310 family coiled-coil domain-containing protein n=1 Tax=Haloprofundus halobius TaxID=2876194 RepID=UPI001CCB1F4E|nr:hypothetical protein [Haloprofundus halobius]